MRVRQSEKGFQTQLRVELSEFYPEECPNFTVTSYWLETVKKTELIDSMKLMFNFGSPGTVQCTCSVTQITSKKR